MTKQEKELNIEYKIFLRYLVLILLMIFLKYTIVWNILAYYFLIISYIFLLPITNTLTINFGISSLVVNSNYLFSIIQACIAPSVYLLFGLLFFSLPISLKKASSFFLKASVYFTLLNTIRIIVLMYVHILLGNEFFESIHLLFYEFLSGILTAVIVIYILHKNNIKKQYPFISDVKVLIKIVSNYWK